MSTKAVPGTGLQRVMAAVPLPQIPTSQFEKLDPAVQQYMRGMNKYMTSLMSALASAQAGGLTLPEVPDMERNWELVFDRDVPLVLWRPLEKWWVRPDIKSSTVVEFDKGKVFLPGIYRLKYTLGGIQYAGVGGGYKINDGSHAYKVRHSDDGMGGFTDVTAPGTNGVSYGTLRECEDDNKNRYIEFTHTGGMIGMYLTDSPFTDNTSESPTVFSLVMMSLT